MPLKKKKRGRPPVEKYTETPELGTDGNPGATGASSSSQSPPRPPARESPSLTELELSGYTGAKVLAFLAELLAVENKILGVLEEIRDDGDED